MVNKYEIVAKGKPIKYFAYKNDAMKFAKEYSSTKFTGEVVIYENVLVSKFRMGEQK